MAGRAGGPGGEATPHLRALVDGLSAVVWEADAGSVAFTFVSDRAEDLLGYPPAAWIGDPGFWPSIIHPDERAAVVAYCATETAAGRDHAFAYRAVAADGRTVWLHDVVHVICDDDGTPRRLQGVMIDVTEQKRAEQAAALLAEAGRVLSGPAAFPVRLAALARLTTGPMGDCTLVSCPDRDGRYRPVAVAHRDPELEPLLARAAHAPPPASVRAALARGEPFVVPDIPDEVRREDDPPPQVAAARQRLRSRAALVVPLAAGGTELGLLTFATRDRSRVYDDADLELARRLGEQLAVAMEADRLRERNRRLFAVTSALAAAASTPEACAAVVRSAQDGLRACYVSVYRLVGDRLHAVHRAGHPEELDLSAFAAVELGAPLPLTDAVRTGRSLWIDTLSELRRRYPHVVDAAAATGIRALAVLPMRVAGGVTGALTLSFDRDHVSTPEDREFARLLADQAGQALERTVAADGRRRIAETLQHSLLPTEPPSLPRLTVARRYLAGAEHAQAGGDWYDVVDLGDGRVAVAVGDVVGQGAGAAAVMGQLRSALAAHLLDGDPPARALRKLDRYSRRVPESRASTAACLVLDTRDGTLRWARAGHLPPLLVGPGGTRYLEDAHGCVLGIPGAPPPTEGSAVLEPGTTILLYTDGLVERRDETIDDGLARLARAAEAGAATGPEELAAAVLDAQVGRDDPPDDVALIVARLGPAPLRGRIPARGTELAVLRDRVDAWCRLAAVPDEARDELQLAVGEAVANAVEHAYAGREPGEVEYTIRQEADRAVAVEVRDRGRWLPARPGRRPGHGLAVIRGLAADAAVDTDEGGTRVRFTVRG